MQNSNGSKWILRLVFFTMRVQCVGVRPSTIYFDISPFVQYIRYFDLSLGNRRFFFLSLSLSDYFTPPVWSIGIQRVQSGIACSLMRWRTQSQKLCPDRPHDELIQQHSRAFLSLFQWGSCVVHLRFDICFIRRNANRESGTIEHERRRHRNLGVDTCSI